MSAITLSGTESQQNYNGVEALASAAMTASYVYTNWSDVRLFEATDWFLYITNVGTITRVDIIVQFSEKLTPSVTADWATLQAESIDSSGIATIADYAIRKTISVATTIGISTPTRGRWMRLGIKVGAGSGTGSAYSVNVLRRKPRTL